MDIDGASVAPKSVVAHAKAAQGVCFDPFNPDHLATFSDDGYIKIWDLRRLVEAVRTGSVPLHVS